MKLLNLIVVLLISSLTLVGESVRPTEQLTYSRGLSADVSLTVIATPEKLTFHIDDKPDITIKIEREDFLRLCDSAKSFFTTKDFSKEDAPKNGRTRIIMFSEGLMYGYEWEYKPEDKNELEAMIFQYYDADNFKEIRTEQNQPSVN